MRQLGIEGNRKGPISSRRREHRDMENRARGGPWRSVERSRKNPLQLLDPRTRNPVLQAGFQFGGMAENNARIALFIDRIKKGDSYDDAAKVVKSTYSTIATSPR